MMDQFLIRVIRAIRGATRVRPHSIDTLRVSHYEIGEKVQVMAMRFRCVFLFALVLSGCAGFDDYFYHDGWVMEGYPAGSSCGCPTTPHLPPQTPPPPLAGAPPITPVSGLAMSPQTREPELLR